MRRLRGLMQRIAGYAFRADRDTELTAEIEEHLRLQTEDNVRSGMRPDHARRAALLKFGSIESAKEQYRDQRGLPQLDSVLQDLRFALRSCRRRPGPIAVIILSLAIGIGLNTTLFTWLKAVYLDPLPGVSDSRHLITINAAYKFGDGYSDLYQDFLYIRDHSQLFEGLFAHELEVLALSDGQATEMTYGGTVSGTYFKVLKTRVAIGRALQPEDDRAAGDPVIVLGDGVWRRRFGADRTILGKTVQVNRVPFTVVGIALPGFMGVYGGIRQDFWIPLHTMAALDPHGIDPLTHGMALQIMGRPKPGVPMSSIQSELLGLSKGIQPLFHKDAPDYRAVAYPLHEAQRGVHSNLFELVRVLGVAVFFLLLLACFNAANLLIGLASERSREIGLRISLGAGRRRIVRQLLTESFMIAIVSSMTGLVLVYATRSLPGALVPPGMELYMNVDIDWQVVLFLLAITAATTVVFGLLPAFETSKTDIADLLREGSGMITAGSRRGVWRRLLVIGQVTLATTALFGAALFTKYVHDSINADRAFQTKNILTTQVDLAAARLSETRGQAFYKGLIERIESMPGVQSAAWTTFLPMSDTGGGNRRNVQIAGHVQPDGKPLSVIVDGASPGYLKTMKISTLRGREFQWSDTQGSLPVMLVNQKFVDEYLTNSNVLGTPVEVDGTWRTIVGVYRNYLYHDSSQLTLPAILLPLTQDYNAVAIAVIRAKGDPAKLYKSLRQAADGFDRNVPLSHVLTMEDSVRFHFAPMRAGMQALLFFAAVACLLSAIGIYAVLSTFVNQRRREFGIRMALGATPWKLRRKVISESAFLTLIGSSLGLLLSLGMGMLIRSTSLTLNPFATDLYTAAIGLILTIAAVSTVAPALIASRLQPMDALRAE